MTLFLVDTASVIEIERRRPDGLEFLRRIEGGNDELATCDVVVAEYYSGRTRGERPAIDNLLDSCAYVATTFAIAARAGNLRDSLARRGVQISMTDALIAAAAAMPAPPW